MRGSAGVLRGNRVIDEAGTAGSFDIEAGGGPPFFFDGRTE